MGIFSKEKCIICKTEVGSFNRTKLNSGEFLCSKCFNKAGISNGFNANSLKEMQPDDIKKRIEYHQQDIKNNNDRLSNFNATYKVGGYIWFDDNHKWLVFPHGAYNSKLTNQYIFKYDEILGFEVLEDGTTITKGGLGKALVGGAIFGLAGAIAGGTSKKIKQICNKLEIKVTTRNIDNPIIYINIINTEFKKDGFIYKVAKKNVQDIISKLQIAVDQVERENEIKKEEIKISVADEIKKFKELLDVGAITQEEYEQKKKELLR